MAKIELYPHQSEALFRMHIGCILVGIPGSGKSRTGLAYYYQQCGGNCETGSRMTEPKDLYIITTAQKRDKKEWEYELVPFGMAVDPELKELSPYNMKIVIDSWNNIAKYSDVVDSFFIFDEQRVVSYGKWSKTFIKIARKNQWILLSATPGDTWQDYAPVFIANGFYRNISQFREEHIVYDYRVKFPKIRKYIGIGRLIRLRNRVLVEMNYAKHTTIPHHEEIICGYDIERYKWVMRYRKRPESLEPIPNASGLCAELRRIVNSDASRRLTMLSVLEKHPKMIVFYNYDYELDILRDTFSGIDGLTVSEWNGHQHNPLPKDDPSWVYLVQYTAGCEGWNCIYTDTIVFYSQNYSYKVMTQACGRIDRLNTPFTDLYYYHLKSTSKIDLAISRALKTKKDFNEGKFVNG